MTKRHSGGHVCSRFPVDTAVPTAPATSDRLITRHGSGIVDGSHWAADAVAAGVTALVGRALPQPAMATVRARTADAAAVLIRTTPTRSRRRPPRWAGRRTRRLRCAG